MPERIARSFDLIRPRETWSSSGDRSVRLIAPKLVTSYLMSGKRGKNDAADAAAICEAVSRPDMRFVAVKTVEQQSRLMVHRAREGHVQQRTVDDRTGRLPAYTNSS